MEFKQIEISKLIPATYNPRKDLTPDDKEYVKIKNSILEFGYIEPLIVNKDYTIIGGHQRFKVLLDIGYKKIDCIVLDVDKVKEKAINIALNKITGEWDNDKLELLLQELQSDVDLSVTGFDTAELNNMLKSIEEAEEDAKEILDTFNYKEQYGVIVICKSEEEQESIYNELQEQGYAIKLGIPVISDCDKLVSSDIPDNTDLVIAAHSHWYISHKIIEKAKYGAIGFHPSLLPRHKGQDAVRWTILMNDAITGGTIFWLDDSIDGGDIFLQRMMFVNKQWDYHKLWKELFPLGVEMICQAVDMIENNNIIKIPQDKQFSTYEPSFTNARLKRNELLQLNSGIF